MASLSPAESLDRLLVQICRLHRARAQTLFESIGLYWGQPPVLGLLAAQEGLSHSELAARLEVSPVTISKTLDRLEKTGFLVRQPDPSDQRVSRVYLTEQGRAVQHDIHRLLRQMAQEIFGELTPEEQTQLGNLLQRVRDSLAHVTGKDPAL